MKYFLDTEFIEGFRKPLFGKKQHFIDLISIGIIREDGSKLYHICNDYNYNDASDWVKEKVILPLYKETVRGDERNRLTVKNFHKHKGLSRLALKGVILDYFHCWRDQHFWRAPGGMEIYGYYADYDWVVFCSLFGTMMDLPKGFPMYCRDLKQIIDEKATKLIVEAPYSTDNLEGALAAIKRKATYPKQENEHSALDDAKWNLALYDFLIKL